MKRIIYSIAVVALSVTACQKTEMLNVVEDTIDFNTYVGKLTKAYEEDRFETLKIQGFKVWAVADFTSGTEVTEGKIYRGMGGLDVIHDNGTWKYKNNNKYLWPQADQYLYFYTLSSSKLTTITEDTFEYTGTPLTPVTGFTVEDYSVDDFPNDDVMVADHIYQQKKEDGKSTKEVRPVFRHTMTKVVFKFKSGAATDDKAPVASNVILKKIETTNNISKAGNLTITYSDGANPFKFDWTDATTAKSSEFKYIPDKLFTIAKEGGRIIPVVDSQDAETAEEGKEIVVYTKENDIITKAEIYKAKADGTDAYSWDLLETHTYTDAAWTTAETHKYETFYGRLLTSDDHVEFVTWYMIPQDLGEDHKVTISYVADGKPFDQKFSLQVDKGATSTADDWMEEQCINYNITIAPHKILFSPSVEAWQTEGEDKNYDMAN